MKIKKILLTIFFLENNVFYVWIFWHILFWFGKSLLNWLCLILCKPFLNMYYFLANSYVALYAVWLNSFSIFFISWKFQCFKISLHAQNVWASSFTIASIKFYCIWFSKIITKYICTSKNICRRCARCSIWYNVFL